MTYEEWSVAHKEALKEENEELICALEDIFWDYTSLKDEIKRWNTQK